MRRIEGLSAYEAAVLEDFLGDANRSWSRRATYAPTTASRGTRGASSRRPPAWWSVPCEGAASGSSRAPTATDMAFACFAAAALLFAAAVSMAR